MTRARRASFALRSVQLLEVVNEGLFEKRESVFLRYLLLSFDPKILRAIEFDMFAQGGDPRLAPFLGVC
jgi:hypothetical protein